MASDSGGFQQSAVTGRKDLRSFALIPNTLSKRTMKTLLIASSLLLAGSLSLATFNSAQAKAPAAAPIVPVVGSFAVDAGHSSVLFKIKHKNTAYSYGRFNEISGTVDFNEADPAKSSVTVKIPTGSVDTNSKKRDEHLLGPDFLDAKQFPELKFTSTEVSKLGDTWRAKGSLDFHGTRKSITIDFEKTGESEGRGGSKVLGFHSQFTIDRTDWGITYGPGALGNDIDVTVSLEVAGQ